MPLRNVPSVAWTHLARARDRLTGRVPGAPDAYRDIRLVDGDRVTPIAVVAA